MKKERGDWILQVPGWLLVAYLVYAQAIPAFDYELGVAMGTQEPAARITEVGAAFWYGFAFGDFIIYIPLLAAGLISHWFSWRWSKPVLAAALGITIYWPVVCLAAIVTARGAEGWKLGDETAYWIVLPAVAVWALGSLWLVVRNEQESQSRQESRPPDGTIR